MERQASRRIDGIERDGVEGSPVDKGEAGRSRKLSEIVAERIITDIRRNGWSAGKLIGTEPELIVRYEVSRATLLEAVRQVERHGVASMRRGGKGGLIVSTSGLRGVARVLSTYIELTNISLKEQFEAARILEVLAARQGAEAAPEDKIERLRLLGQQAIEADSYLELSRLGLRILNVMAESSGNPATSLFIRALVQSRSDFFQVESRRDRPVSRAMQDYARELFELVEAIASGDAALAEHWLLLQRQHLNRESEERFSRLAAKGSPLVAAARRREAGQSDRGAEVFAFMIRDEIVERGWPIGERLGNETEIRERYKVSRWVFRQAVRILEPHAIIATRRGQGGGIVVGEPDPTYTVDSALSYLVHEQLPVRQAVDVWTAIAEESVKLAAMRRDSDAENPDAAPRRLGGIIAPSPDDGDEHVRDFFSAIFDLTHNRVLSLFGQVLTVYLHQHGGLATLADADAERVTIMEAIAAGDAPLARRRMRDHLRRLAA